MQDDHKIELLRFEQCKILIVQYHQGYRWHAYCACNTVEDDFSVFLLTGMCHKQWHEVVTLRFHNVLQFLTGILTKLNGLSCIMAIKL